MLPRPSKLAAAFAVMGALSGCRERRSSESTLVVDASVRASADATSAKSLPQPAPREVARTLPAEFSASIAGHDIDTRNAEAWALEDGRIRVIFSDGLLSCTPRKKGYSPSEHRFEVFLTDALMPDGTFRWHVLGTYHDGCNLFDDLGEMKLDRTNDEEIGGTLSETKSVLRDLGPEKTIACELRFRGPFVARNCGQEDEPRRVIAPRPEPRVKVLIANHEVSILGSIIRQHGDGDAEILELTSEPTDCGEVEKPPFRVLVALLGGPTGASVSGSRMPIQVGDHVTPGSHATVVNGEPGPIVKLDVGFRDVAGYSLSVRGEVHPIRCESAAASGGKRSESKPSP